MKPYGSRPSFGPLLDVGPPVRREGPDTSREAAVALKGSKRLGELQHLALEAVKTHPGSTANELSQHEGFPDPRIINRRLSELKRAGKVKTVGTSVDPATGRRGMRWWPV
jgi:predicted HTH transcriptional regulator